MHPFPRRWAVSCGALSGLPSFMRTLSCPFGGPRTAFFFLFFFVLFCFVFVFLYRVCVTFPCVRIHFLIFLLPLNGVVVACDHGRRPKQMPSTEYCADVGTTFNVKTTTTTTTIRTLAFSAFGIFRTRYLGVD